MYPKVEAMNNIYGINSQKKFNLLPKYILFNPFNNIPNIIYVTPIIIDNFIFKEFMNANLFSASPQAPSTPKNLIHYVPPFGEP